MNNTYSMEYNEIEKIQRKESDDWSREQTLRNKELNLLRNSINT